MKKVTFSFSPTKEYKDRNLIFLLVKEVLPDWSITDTNELEGPWREGDMKDTLLELDVRLGDTFINHLRTLGIVQ